MGSFTDFMENELLDHIFNAAYTAPTTVYVALATADPTDAATGASMNEVANANAYARTAITFGAASARRVTQSGVVTFPQASGSWGTVTHWAITDNATHGAGNVMAHGAFASGQAIVSGNTPSIASGQIYVEIPAANGASDYLANTLLDFAFRNQAFAAPDTFIGLTTVIPSDSDTGSTITEPVGGSYARVQVNPNGGASPTWTVASAGALTNNNAITFPQASGSWGTIVYAVVVSASTAGNLIAFGDITDQAVGTNDTVEFAVNDFDVSLS